LLQDDTWITKKDGRLIPGTKKHEPVTHTKKYDIGLFIKMILDRGKRKLSKYLNQTGITFE